MDEKLMAELANIKSGLETKTAAEVKAAIDAFETKLPDAIKSTFDAEIKSVTEALEAKFAADLKVVQDHAEKLDLKLQEQALKSENIDILAKTIKENAELITKGKGAKLEIKAAANMTTSNLTGTKPRTYNYDIVTLPSQMVNIEDLAGMVMAENGNYTYTRETGALS